MKEAPLIATGASADAETLIIAGATGLAAAYPNRAPAPAASGDATRSDIKPTLLQARSETQL